MGNTNTQPNTPYSLRWPEDTDVADVPQDIKELAQDVATELAKKLDKATPTDTMANYQRKVTVQTTAPTPTVPANPADGDIVFVVPAP